jgi:hypothetical protein
MATNKGQLVCQHLESMSRAALEKYQSILKEYVKGRHGVYALYRKGHLYYVGLASNLRNRLKTHLRDRHARTWDTFSVYLTINDSHLHELETLLLKIASPKGNKQSGNFINSENLKPRFKRQVSTAWRKELDSLLGVEDEEPIEKMTCDVKEKGRKPILAGYFTERTKIRLRYKGKTYKAAVRKDGSILYAGKIYNSPSHAGWAIKKKATNGWTNWKYEKAPGYWVLLDTLRKK